MTLVLNGTTGISAVDGSAATPAIQGGDTNTGVFFPAADTVAIATGGTERLRADSSGNVGIGTSSPSYKLDVSGSPVGQPLVRVQNPASHEATIRYTTAHSSSSDYKVGASITVANAFEIYSVAAGVSRAIIDSSGNLLVNTTGTTPVQSNTAGAFAYRPTAQLEINGNNTQAAFFGRTNDGMVVGFYSGGTRRGSVDISGATTSYVTSSDYRLKEDVAPMTGALAKVGALKPVVYKWKEDGKSGQGFIAHELQAVVPECVTGEKDAVDENGNPVYQGIDTSFLVATLTAAIQEQQAMIVALKAEVDALKGAQA